MNQRSVSFLHRTTLFLLGIVLCSALLQAKRPNVVFILTDDQRGDALSCMGHPHLKDPTDRPVGGGGSVVPQSFLHHFAVLAQPGIHPRRALCPCPWGGQ